MEREFVAQHVHRSLIEAESEVESAIVKTTALLSGLYAAKRELGLAGPAGAEETARVGRAIAAMQQAHGELVSTHHGLDLIGRALKLRTKAVGWKPITGSRTLTDDAAAA